MAAAVAAIMSVPVEVVPVEVAGTRALGGHNPLQRRQRDLGAETVVEADLTTRGSW